LERCKDIIAVTESVT